MLTWLVGVALLGGAGLSAFLFWRLHRAKRDRVSLRLLAGRSRLLAEEVEHHAETLGSFDYQGLAHVRQQAQEALDQLHLLLVERQAHLLSYAELVGLQAIKIGRLNSALEPAPPPPPALPALEPEPAPAPERESVQPAAAEPESASTRRDRAGLEGELLSKIGELHEPRRDKKTPPRT